MKRKVWLTALLALLLAMLLPGAGIGSRKAYAGNELFKEQFAVDSDESMVKEFTLKKNMILYFSFDFKRSSGTSTGKDGIFFAVYDANNSSEILSETFQLNKGSTDGSFWFYSDDKIDAGKYSLEIEGLTKNDIKGSVKVTEYPGFATSIGKIENVSVKTGKTKTVKLTDIKPAGALPNIVFHTTSGVSVADIFPDYGAGTVDIVGTSAGSMTVEAKLDNGKKYSFTVKVTDPGPALNYKKFTLESGYTDTIELQFASGKRKWKSTNKKVATVSSNGLITAKSKGKCKIYTTYKGKKYTATVKVTAGVPWYDAKLYKYDTKKNIFIVKIKNRNKKDLIILPTKAKAVEDHYSDLDRDLKLVGGKKVTIKPGKTVKLQFKVDGAVTYKNAANFYVYYYMKYDGTKYYARTWTAGGAYKKGKKWYSGN